MRLGTVLAIGVVFLTATAPAASAEVTLAINEGRVTLVATDATVSQILTEWARVGQTRIVNVERIPGGPLTLQLTGVSESEALDLLLRSVTGYMAVQRPVAASNLSRYDRILVLPTAAVARVPVTTSPAPVFQQPVQRPAESESDDGPSIPPPRGPLFQTLPSPQPGFPAAQEQFNPPPPGFDGLLPPGVDGPNGPQPSAPLSAPSAVGTPRPGMVIPAPVQPGQGGQPGQPVPRED